MVVVSVLSLLGDCHFDDFIIKFLKRLRLIKPMSSEHRTSEKLILKSSEHRVPLYPLGHQRTRCVKVPAHHGKILMIIDLV
jgi:hypothetical protein